MRLFVQIFIGEVRNWFKALTPGSLRNWDELEDSFLRKWGSKVNLVQALTEYNNLKRDKNESDLDFYKRFNKVYNFIPAHIKPHPGAAQLCYVGAFDYDFSIILREREFVTLVEMQNDVVKIEVNMDATKRSKMGKERLKEEEQPSTSSDVKFDTMMKTMEGLMDRLSLGNNTPLLHNKKHKL